MKEINFKNYSTEKLILAVNCIISANEIYGKKDKKGLIRELEKLKIIQSEIKKRQNL